MAELRLKDSVALARVAISSRCIFLCDIGQVVDLYNSMSSKIQTYSFNVDFSRRLSVETYHLVLPYACFAIVF